MKTPIIDIHTHKENAPEGVIAIRNFDWNETVTERGLYSVGVHPWNLDDDAFDWRHAMVQVTEKAANDGCIAIGEAGLDKVHKSSFGRQKELFSQQVALSETIGKPLVIHCVRSVNELLEFHKTLHPSQQWIVHGFNGSKEEVARLCADGIMLSVGESLMHSERKICGSLTAIPSESLFFETDTSDIPITDVYCQAAMLLGTDLVTLTAEIFSNFVRIFHFKEI